MLYKLLVLPIVIFNKKCGYPVIMKLWKDGIWKMINIFFKTPYCFAGVITPEYPTHLTVLRLWLGLRLGLG